MTALADPPLVPLSSTSATPRVWLRRNRGALLLLLGLVAALLLLVLTSGVGRSGSLDPDSYEPSGARALATLLRQQGVDVRRTTDVPSTTDALPAGATIVVSDPTALSALEISDLQGAGATLVLPGAAPETVAELGVDAPVVGLARQKDREPGCGWGPALAAGTVRTGGFRYAGEEAHALRCYDGTLVALPDQDLVLLGGGDVLSNAHLGDQGDAELGLQLLGRSSTVRWLVPDPNRAVEGDRPARSLGDFVAPWLSAGLRWLAVVAVVLLLWRGRRLGRVVPEPLPVVVRAAETVEGRGRLYRAAGARGSAADALRSGAVDVLARRLGAGRHPSAEALVELVARRTSRPAATVQALLYGPPPADDDALLRLARDLDALTQEVSGS